MVKEIEPQNANPLATLNQSLTPNTIQFLKDAIREKPELQPGLWAIIEASKQDESKAQAASSAITVLNAARISFSGRNLQNIRIPGADLSGAILDNTNLENANLSNVNLTGAWLHGTNFKNALLAGLILGEYPSLLLQDSVGSICYSRDGTLLAAATGNNIHVYNSQTRMLLKTLTGHTSRVNSVAFSPDGRLLASGSGEYKGRDNTVKLWDIERGELKNTLEGHVDSVNSVAFSLDGNLLVSGSSDEEC